jgi:hypothetical protein
MSQYIDISEVENEISDSSYYLRQFQNKFSDFNIIYYFHYQISNTYHISVYLIISTKGDIILSHPYYHKTTERRFNFPGIELDQSDKDLYLSKVKFKISSIKKLIDERLHMKYERKLMKENDTYIFKK